MIFFRTVSQILTAGIAITAFSLFLYALAFNFRDRVVRTFLLILACIVIVFTGEAIGSTSTGAWQVDFWLRVQWIGIILLPATYLHFSDALLATTGRPSRWRRIWAVRVTYVLSFGFLITLPLGIFVGPVVMDVQPANHLMPTLVTDLFTLFYLAIMILAWINFVRAYQRTVTPTSRRRMGYLTIGSLAPSVGSFPYLLFSSPIAAEHPLAFWIIAVVINTLLGGMVVVMAYSVSFFGVPWPDRIVKSRLFKWIMRGPVTASFTLGLMTIVRRIGVVFGDNYSALVPIIVVTTILLCEYVITLMSPLWERFLFYGKDRDELVFLEKVQNRLLTRNDLRQFIEMLLAAVCDRLQAPGAYLVTMNGDELELAVRVGAGEIENLEPSADQILEMVSNSEKHTELFKWGADYLVPIFRDEENIDELLGILGISQVATKPLDEEHLTALGLLVDRAAQALRDRYAQQKAFRSLESLTPEMEYLQEVRAVARYDGSKFLTTTPSPQSEDMALWVKEALTHYWGGPKLTQNPLMQLQIVKNTLDTHDGNYSNALRSILRSAMEKVKPEGERRFTGDWILYNILEMKFLEGRKVREVAMRLAMSEADLYRKQRVAIDEVAKAIFEMETQAREQTGG